MIDTSLLRFYFATRNRKKIKGFFIYLLFLTCLLGSLTPLTQEPVLAVDIPQPLTPSDGTTITATGYGGSTANPPMAVPQFSWTDVSGTTVYRLQISQDIAFTTRVEFTTPLTRYTPTDVGRFSDGLWYWRVRVEGPVVGDYSTIQTFNRQWASPDNLPTLISPSEAALLEFVDPPSFSWSHVIGAAQYRLQIASSPEFNPLIVNQTTLAPTHQPATKLANGTYYWRVIPLDPIGREGAYSETRIFYQGYNQVPQLIEPVNGSLPTFTPTFLWTAEPGAQFYRLQYSTDPTFNTNITTVDTKNTTFTPTIALPNDVNYYWRVRTHSGNSISDWSSVWTFRKQWYIKPVLLTPVNNYQFVRFPYFSWTSVPSASYYKIEIDKDLDFVGALTENVSNLFYIPRYYEGDNHVRYWRVTPYDRNNNAGKTSDVSSYVSSYDFNAPQLIFPYYYYLPNNFPAPDQGVFMDPHGDYSVALPIFIWHRLTVPYPTGGTLANAYRLQLSSDPLFNSLDWTVDTENTSAAPTASNPFIPDPNTLYYWRVRALTGIGGTEIGEWSQTWKTRFDLSSGLSPTSGAAPQLIRPVQATEIVETTPLLEWWPLEGAGTYEVQISADPGFATLLDSGSVSYPAYAPTISLAQRLLNRLNFGTYYWRLRAVGGTPPPGGWLWSETWRFQIASQSEWLRTRTLGDPANQLLIASDPDDTADNNYELTTLFSTQDANYWYFGFNATATATDMVYALFMDLDHLDGVGATGVPEGYSFSTIPAHQPEFALYIHQTSGNISAGQTYIYAWTGSGWGTPQTLAAVGGELYWNAGYLEMKVPNTAIGMQDTTGSYALSLVSLPASGGVLQDSVPSDPNVPAGGPLSRFASVSEHLNLVLPPNNADGSGQNFAFVPPFYWDFPTGSNGTSPWAGVKMRAYLDPQYTNQIADYTLVSTGAYYASMNHDWPSDFQGDNSYYWRVQPRYLDAIGAYFGSWSQGWRFERQGFVPQNLRESVTLATPTFDWDIVEGAESYDVQVDNDPGFGSTEFSINTTQNSYTPIGTLANAIYYWRVRARRWGGIINEWSTSKTFTLTLPQPTGLTPNDPSALNPVDRAPTLCWDQLVSFSNGEPVLTAYKYKVQVSKGDPGFSVIYESVETEQNCWTPVKGYDDGQYYWRVAMMDGQSRQGDYSPPVAFTKQYPSSALISPVDQTSRETPTFAWTAVNGASSYKLEVSQSSTFSPLYESITTHNTDFTPTKLYQSPATYYWRVAIIDKDGKIGPFTDATIILNPSAADFMTYLPIAVR
jgi:hypothetical protein